MGQDDSKPSVLVADDEKELRVLMADLFRDSGFDVFEAETGRGAIEILKEKSVDAVVSDVRMPDGSGPELLDWINELDNRPKAFVLITGFTDLTEEGAKALGADRLMTKPFRSQNLITEVLKILGNGSVKVDLAMKIPGGK